MESWEEGGARVAELVAAKATSAASDVDVVLSLVLSLTTKTNVLSLTHQPWR